MTNETLNRPRWWLLYWKLLFASPGRAFWSSSYVAFVILGWWIPNDVFVRYPETQPFADFMANLIPQVRRAGELGGAAAGNANRFLYSVMWAAMPLYGTLLAFHMNRYNRVHGFPKRVTYLTFAGYIAIAVATIVAVLWVPFSGTSHASVAAWRNPLTRSLFAPAMATSPFILAINLLLQIRGALSGRFLRTNDPG